METLIKASQLILSLSILITLHELGHFIPAKLFKTRVSKFYLFFDFLFPFPNIGNFSLFKFKKGETEYGLGWFPFGGYVQIAGMIDETTDKEQLEKEPQPWEFRSKPAWQRLIIMIGGVTVNFILAFIIYSGVLWAWGQTYIPAANAKYGIHCDDLAKELGFQEGDKIIGLNGDDVTQDMTVEQISGEIIINNPAVVTINRNGEEVDIRVPDEFDQKVLAAKTKSIFALRYPVVIDTTVVGSPADEAGLKSGDSIVMINNVQTAYFFDLVKELKKDTNQLVQVTFFRNGEQKTTEVNVTAQGTIGFYNTTPDQFFNIEQKDFNLISAIPAGWNMTIHSLDKYVAQIPLLFTKEGAKQLGGFGTMAKMFQPTWDWHAFWVMTALISVILAFMNLLPIPMLDGGYVFFLIIEMIIRRPVPDKVIEIANMFGLAIVLLLLVYANGMDIFRGFIE